MSTIDIKEMMKHATSALKEAVDNAYKTKFVAVKTRHGEWLVVEREGHVSDTTTLLKSDNRLKVCANEQEARAFIKLLKEN